MPPSLFFTIGTTILYLCGGGGGGLVAKSCPTIATPWLACQAPLSMGFSRQEYWSGLPFPSPGFIYVVSIIPHQWHFQGKKYWDVSSITHSDFYPVCILLNITVGANSVFESSRKHTFLYLKNSECCFWSLFKGKKKWVHLLVNFVSLISLFVVLYINIKP